MPTAWFFFERSQDGPRAQSVFEISELPESVRRCSTSASINGLSSGLTTTCIGSVMMRVREGAQFPVSEVRRREEDAAAVLHRILVVLAALAADPLRDVVAADRGKPREGDEEAGDRAEDAVDDRPRDPASGIAMARLYSAVRRSRGMARSSRRAYAAGQRGARSASGASSSDFSAASAGTYSSQLRNAERRRITPDCSEWAAWVASA